MEYYSGSDLFLEQQFTYKLKEINIIAEIKQASLSKGIISNNFKSLIFTKNFVKNGVNSKSILWKLHKFLGHEIYLKAIKNHIKVSILS